MLACQRISHAFGEKVVLSNCSLCVNVGERMGLVGANGSGKTTLLKIMVGLIEPDQGKVRHSPHVVIGYLSQEIGVEAGRQSVIEFISAFSKVSADEIVSDSEFTRLFRDMSLDPSLLERSVSELSGGEKSKINLIRLLVSDCDIYLLDEPTNNLDLVGLLFLKRFIKESDAAFVLVSHDRKLLDETVTRIIELDEWNHGLRLYVGGWTDYTREREARITREWARYKNYQEKVEELDESIREAKQWAVKGQKGPKRVDHEKIARGYRKNRSEVLGRRAKSLERRRDYVEEAEKPRERLPMKLSLEIGERSGNIVFELKHVEKRLSTLLLGPLNLTVSFGEKVAILGPNGSGKTTLLRLLIRAEKLDCGELRMGSRINIGYLPQEYGEEMREQVLPYFLEATDLSETDARKVLNRFGVRKEDISRTLGELSPGQRSRTVIARLMTQRVNCLILDEPSNHLDVEALRSLESALANYEGTIIVVSHDRYFLDKVVPTTTYLLSGGEIGPLRDYHDYEREILA